MAFPISWSSTVSVQGVTVAQALGRLEGALEDEGAVDVQAEGRSIRFRGGLFVGWRRRSFLQTISSGAVKVSYTVSGVDLGYHLALTPLLINVIVALAFIGVPTLASNPAPVGIAIVSGFSVFAFGAGYGITLSRWSSFLMRSVRQPRGRPGDSRRAAQRSSWNRLVPIVIAVGALGIGAGVLGLLEYDDWSERRARQDLLGMLADSTDARLNGQPVEDPSLLLRSLGSVDHVPPHHSGPGTPVRIELLGKRGTMEVTIARDAHRPDEFWVFVPGRDLHQDPRGREAGRITSGELDGFLKARGL